MINRRSLLAGMTAGLAAQVLPASAHAQAVPSAAQIEKSLSAAPARRVRREDRVDRSELRRRHDLREIMPSIDIQAINFEFGSHRIPRGEWYKVEEIAIALRRMSRHGRFELVLIEGHTDAVGSRYANQLLSERRARSLRDVLVRHFGVDPYMLETVGYGEDYLLVPTPNANWRNRRVTLRRVTDVVIR